MAKQYFKDGKLATDDWQYVGDNDPLPASNSIVSLERLRANGEDIAAHPAKLGLVIRAGSKEGESIEEAQAVLDQIALIAIDFPTFRNGRGFSTARILREDLGFKGELRAIGEILFDQLFFLHRCGFDAYEIGGGNAPSLSERQVETALHLFNDAYQPASDNNAGILWRRQRS